MGHECCLGFRTTSEDGLVKLDVRLHNESLWLTQAAMAELFQTTQQNISQHIQNIFDEGELTALATNKKFLLVRQEGNRAVEREIEHAKIKYDKFAIDRRRNKESLAENDYLKQLEAAAKQLPVGKRSPKLQPKRTKS